MSSEPAARRGGTFHFKRSPSRTCHEHRSSAADLCPRRSRIRARRGRWLISTNGERYLDFTGGVAVNVLGHAHPYLVAEAITEQAKKAIHVSNLFRIPEQERLAERLCAASFADYVFFCNSGAEAMEVRDQDGAQVSTPSTASPSATGSSPSRAPSTAARSRRSRPAGRRNISKASARWSKASIRCRSATSTRSRTRSGRRPRRS